MSKSTTTPVDSIQDPDSTGKSSDVGHPNRPTGKPALRRGNPFWALVHRELRSGFNSPIAYIVALFFLLFTSVWFFTIQEFFARDTASLRSYFSIFPFVFIVLIPSLTMRSWAEETRQGTLELMVTLPAREWDLVLGKFIANLILLAIILVGTLPTVAAVLPFGDFDPGPIISQYVGIFLLGAAGLALGQSISLFTRNQVSAFISTAGVLLLVTIAEGFVRGSAVPLFFQRIMAALSLGFHFEDFAKGIIDSQDLFFFLGVIWLFLFINARTLLLRKWR